MNYITKKTKTKCRIFYNFFSECAGKAKDSKNNYLLTTAFYHAVKKYYGEEVGILYSSSATENFGINVVLSKKIVDLGYLKLDSVIVYDLYKNPLVQNKLTGFPSMLAFVEDGEDFELKKMSLVEIHSATRDHEVENAKKLRIKLNAYIIGSGCCSECDKILGVKFPFERILQTPILPYHKCCRPNYCNCIYGFEPATDENGNFIAVKY